MNKFEQMQAFVAVVDAGSFVAAAERQRVSKAAISRQVSELERRLGTRLLQRTTRRLSLTEEGRRFLERCKEVLAGVEAAESEATTHGREVVGLLRINVPQTFGVLHLAPVWSAFRAANPKVLLEVTLSDRVVDLVHEGYDLAVRITRLADSTLVSRRLTDTRMVLCASPGYLQRHGAPRHPAELAEHATAAYTYWSTHDEWHFDGPAGPVVARTRPWLHSNSGETCRAVALADQAIILQPAFLVDADLRSGALVELLPEFRALQLGVFAVYPTRLYLQPRVRAMVDFLAKHFREPSWARS